MLELPRITPNFVDDKRGLSYGVEAFVSDAGIPTRITTSSRGIGFSMGLKYDGLFPSQVGEFFEFLDTIRYDYDAGQSAIAFHIPANHPLWIRVKEREYVEPLLTTQNLDTALWQIMRASEVKTPLININGISMMVRNTWI